MRRHAIIAIVGYLASLVCAGAQTPLKQVNTFNPAAVLSGPELAPIFQSSLPLVAAQVQAISDAGAVNPLYGYGGSGSVALTTGSIAASSNTVTMTSTTGWSVGMGIAIASANSGSELVVKVTAIVSNVMTLTGSAVGGACASAGSCVVNHDDTAAISAALTVAMSTKKPFHCTAGDYNVTSGLTAISTPITFIGDGATACIIWNRSTTANVFTINYQNSDLNTGPVTVSAIFRDFGVRQAAGITPTAGAAFFIASAGGTSGSPKFYVTGLHMQNVAVQFTWEGIETGDGVSQNEFFDVRIYNTVSGCGIKYNSNIPSGDNNWDSVQLFEISTALCIVRSDTQTFTNLKLNGSAILMTGGSAGAINRVRFANTSIEGVGGSPACAIDFGTNGATQIEFRGGEIGGINAPLCHGGVAGTNVTGGLSVHMLLTDGGFNAIGTLDVETGLPTSCSGLITGRIANISGAMTVCP